MTISDKVAAQPIHEMKEVRLPLTDKEGRNHTGRFRGVRLADDVDVQVFVTGAGTVVLVNATTSNMTPVADPEEDLRGALGADAHVNVMAAIGIKAVVDLDV